MSKTKLSPRERKVLEHFDSNEEEIIEELQELSDNALKLIDILYLDVVIGQEKEDIKERIETLEKSLATSSVELKEYKNKIKKPKKKLIIKQG